MSHRVGKVRPCRSRRNLVAGALLPFLQLNQLALSSDIEPNDTLANSQSIGAFVSADLPVQIALIGEIGNGNSASLDVDLYRVEFETEGAGVVLLELSASATTPSLDPHLRLFDSEGTEVRNNDDHDVGSTDAIIHSYLTQGNPYYFGVSAAKNPLYLARKPESGRPGSIGTYEVTLIAEMVTPETDPNEPNDSVLSPTFVGSSSFQTSGFIGDGNYGARDVDVFQLALGGPARIEIELNGESDVVPIFDPVLRVRDCQEHVEESSYGDDCLIAEVDDHTSGESNPIVAFGITKPGDVFILVSGAGNRRFNPAAPGSGENGSVGGYTLMVDVDYLDTFGADEPNDSMSIAADFATFSWTRPTTRSLIGHIGDGKYAKLGGDRDFYEVKVPDLNAVMTVNVTSLSGDLDPVVTVYDRLGKRIGYSDNKGASTDAQAVVPTGCAPIEEGGVSAYVAVSGAGQRPVTDPFLPKSAFHPVPPDQMTDGPGSEGPYQLDVSVVTDLDSCDNEPDNQPVDATDTHLLDKGMYLCNGGNLTRNNCNDQDRWLVHVQTPPVYVDAAVSFCRGVNEMYSIELLSQDGVALASQRDNPHHNNSFSSLDISAWLDKPGDYYVVVKSLSSRCIDPVLQEYSLQVEMRSVNSGTVAAGTAANSLSHPLYAAVLDAHADQIDIWDTVTFKYVGSIRTPTRLYGSESMATDGASIFLTGTGRFPLLKQIDIETEAVQRQYPLWMGSGFFSDATVLGNELFILDYIDSAVHVIDPYQMRFLRTLKIDSAGGTGICGGIAGIGSPTRLLVGDAFGTGEVYEVDPVSGVVEASMTPKSQPLALAGSGHATVYVSDWRQPKMDIMNRLGETVMELQLNHPVATLASLLLTSPFGDGDGDSDVDLDDHSAFLSCFSGPGVYPGPCVDHFDRNYDLYVDMSDVQAMQISIQP